MGALKDFRFPSMAAYRVVASKGKRLRIEFLNLKILPAPDACTRFCLIVKKKNGNAVFRNRCRRVLRPIFFAAAKSLKEPFWIMAAVEMNGANANWETLKNGAERLPSIVNKL